MIKILGRATSSNVQAVMWTLAELEIPHEREDFGFTFGGTDTSEFRAKNPNGLVPVMQDGDLTMFESAAIVRYLGAAYGDDTFYPNNPKERAKLDVWAEWAKTTFYPSLIGQVFFPMVRLDPGTVDQDALLAAIGRINDLALMLDDFVDGGKYSNGDAISFADIMVGHLLFRYFDLDFEKPKLANLRGYYDRLCEREAYRSHVMVDYGALRWRPS